MNNTSKPVWDRPNPKKKSKKLTTKQKASAKASAKKVGRPYPNLIDNMKAARKKSVAKTAAWQRKEGKNPKGGLNAKGRASAKAQGMNLKPPVSAKQAKKSPKAAARRKSFCARMGGMPGPMKDSKGRPTRKALALRKWDC